MINRRVCILLMDSFGVGASLDADQYGDVGADTFGHIVETCKSTDRGPLRIPHLAKLGLYHAALASSGVRHGDESCYPEPQAYYGYAVEQSLGKDTPSGHWELTGVPVHHPWGYFEDVLNCFPKAFMDAFIREANLPGVLGEKHASGTDIIKELGETHQKTGKPIVYTSADSVFQIAAHEESFGLDRLYSICEVARKLLDEHHIGRVIARPFLGQPGAYFRTGNRHDYAMPPPGKSLLDILKEAGRDVISIGKVDDIFAHLGTTSVIRADGNQALFDATLLAMKTAKPGSLVFTNFVDFDSSYGHRRDVLGYADALEAFDARLPELMQQLLPGDMVVIAADHGCDPTFKGTDHTREHIPVLAFGPQIEPRFIGRRETFADVGQSIAEYLQVSMLLHGVSFL